MDWDNYPDGDDQVEYEGIEVRILSETARAYKMMNSDLTTFWVPKSVSQEDGAGGLVVQEWFIEKEGLKQ